MYQKNLLEEHFLLTLHKIRMFHTFNEMGHLFGCEKSWASKIFLTWVPKIAMLARIWIYNPDKNVVKRNLPIAFRSRFSDVSKSFYLNNFLIRLHFLSSKYVLLIFHYLFNKRFLFQCLNLKRKLINISLKKGTYFTKRANRSAMYLFVNFSGF